MHAHRVGAGALDFRQNLSARGASKPSVTTAYRDEEAALKERLAEREEELEALRKRTRELRDAESAEKRVAAEADALRARLEQLRGPSMDIDRLRVASPCKADWNGMVGDDRVRFCGQCQKNVYNLSGMRRDEASALVRDRTGEMCVRFWRRADGTVLTADCPVGARRKNVRRLVVLAAGGGALAVAGAAMALSQGDVEEVAGGIQPRLGEVEVVAGGLPPAPPQVEAEPHFEMGDVEPPKPEAPRPPGPRPRGASGP
jgi:hypothetical protein